MCIFSNSVESVSKTSILVNRDHLGIVTTVYQMTYEASHEIAMILPVPIADPASFRFVDLSEYPNLIKDLDKPFNHERWLLGDTKMIGALSFSAPLPVERVGAYDATFVPSVADMNRLDPRFSLSPALLGGLPSYIDTMSFAVFKLRAGNAQVHPMGYQYMPKNSGELFFPTFHVHHGAIPRLADYDHNLYTQARPTLGGHPVAKSSWMKSPDILHAYWGGRKRPEFLRPITHIRRMTISGVHVNTDIVVSIN